MGLSGVAIADWLRANIDPSRIYDHRELRYLAQVGIEYDAQAHVLILPTGDIAPVPTYSPSELVRHPVVQVHGIADSGDPEARQVLGFEIAAAVHQLVWPTEMPPGQPEQGWRVSFRKNLDSIAQRGEMPYRDTPPGGWWRVRKPTRSKR